MKAKIRAIVLAFIDDKEPSTDSCVYDLLVLGFLIQLNFTIDEGWIQIGEEVAFLESNIGSDTGGYLYCGTTPAIYRGN